jgi:hypothetical protein
MQSYVVGLDSVSMFYEREVHRISLASPASVPYGHLNIPMLIRHILDVE